jgi:hypothetical protein
VPDGAAVPEEAPAPEEPPPQLAADNKNEPMTMHVIYFNGLPLINAIDLSKYSRIKLQC